MASLRASSSAAARALPRSASKCGARITPAAAAAAAPPCAHFTSFALAHSHARRQAFSSTTASQLRATARLRDAQKQQQQQKACSSCGTTQPLISLACPSCNSLQPLPSIEPSASPKSAPHSRRSALDIYELFGLHLEDVGQNGWAVSENDIKSTWRRLMGLTHPDRMAGRSEKEQQIAAQQSAVVNRAYETLLNPLLRAQYLLERSGVPPADEADSLEDAQLLMEVMELREQLDEASSEEEAQQVRASNSTHLSATLHALAQAFGASPPDLATARKLTIELRYWLNIDKAAREWAPGKRVELQH
ncbi:molecular chaperone [Tilletia horrida]|nr:molecular chaperone [Tilletia horrida]